MNLQTISTDIYRYLVDGNLFIEFLLKGYSAYRIGSVVVFSFLNFCYEVLVIHCY